MRGRTADGRGPIQGIGGLAQGRGGGQETGEAGHEKPEVTLTIADELKRARAIAEIDGESFVQADFRTDHMAGLQGVKREEGAKFDFGTSAEDASGPKVGGGKGVDGGLAHPKLFGDQAKREKRFLERVFALRQAALAGKSK